MEEKHPLYYRPWKRLWQVQDSLTLDVFICSKGKEKRGTKQTNPTHGSLVLENTRPCRQRDAVGERGTSREGETHTSPWKCTQGVQVCHSLHPAAPSAFPFLQGQRPQEGSVPGMSWCQRRRQERRTKPGPRSGSTLLLAQQRWAPWSTCL